MVFQGCQTLPGTSSTENEIHLALLSDTHIGGDRERAKDPKGGFDPWENLHRIVPDILARPPRGVILNGDGSACGMGQCPLSPRRRGPHDARHRRQSHARRANLPNCMDLNSEGVKRPWRPLIKMDEAVSMLTSLRPTLFFRNEPT